MIQEETINDAIEGFSDNELDAIKKWKIADTKGLIDFLKDLWNYDSYLKENWILKKDSNTPILILELHTGGWSGHEDVIDALESNEVFWTMFWMKTERGGHYTFEIDFQKIGFKLVSSFCKENNISRQYVFKAKEKFEFIEISPKKKFIRKKT